MHEKALEHVRGLSSFLRTYRDQLTIDADTHVSDTVRYPRKSGDHYYHGKSVSPAELVAEMDLAGVNLANIWQNPASTIYPGGEDENAEALLEANRFVLSAATEFPSRFLPSGWTDPGACGVANACRIAELCVKEFGFLIVKMNPAQNRFKIDTPAVSKVLDRIVELGAIPAFHYGADSPFTPAEGLEAIALRHPDHPVIAVHMGGGGAGYLEAEQLYHQSIELGLRRANIRFVFSALRDRYIEEALIQYQQMGHPFQRNLFCGSDAPYGRMSWNFGGFRAMLEGLRKGHRHPDPRLRSDPGLFDEESVTGFLGSNFADLVVEGYDRLLQVQDR